MEKNWNEEERIKEFERSIPPMFNEDLRELMVKKNFFSAPSSANKHGAFEGGLFWHSRMVAILLREYTDKLNLKWERPESPEIIAWTHDLCKMDEFEKARNGDGALCYAKKHDTILSGHGTKSAIMALSKMYLTDEEITCICWHMGAFEGKEKWDAYCSAVKRYQNILWVHQADMVASQVKGI